MDRTRTAGRLSALDAAFLYFERPHEPLVVGCVVELESAPERRRLLADLASLVRRVPRLRERPVRSPLDLERPRWKRDPGFSVGRHLRHVVGPRTKQEQAHREAVETALSRRLPRDRPLWDVASIEPRSGGPALLVLRAHHCLLDGMSGMRLVELLSTPIAEERPRSAARAHAPKHALRRSPADPLWDGARALAELTATCVSLLHDAPAPPTPFNGALGKRRRAVWTTFSQAAFDAVRAGTEATLNDTALAVISGALRRLLRRHSRGASRAPLRAVIPVSLRASASPASDVALGNELSVVLPRLPIDVAGPRERLARVVAEMRSLKERGQADAIAWALGLAGALPSPLEAMLPRLVPGSPVFNTVCTNVAGPTQPRTLAGRRIVGLHGIAPLFQGMGVEFAIVSHAGRVSICANLDPELVRGGDALAEDLQESFAQLERADVRTARPRAVGITTPTRPPSRYANGVASSASRARSV